MKKHSQKDRRDNVLHVLANKYQIDPERFRAYLPELVSEIEDRLPSTDKTGHISALTEIERQRLRDLLRDLPRDRSITEEQAIQALGYCATLIQDESLPSEVDRKTVLTFLHTALGAPVSEIGKTTEKPIGNGKPVKTIAVLRGAYLHLTWDDQVVAISISPAKFKERSEALRLVGTAKDSVADLSRQHDRYFAESVKCHPPKE